MQALNSYEVHQRE